MRTQTEAKPTRAKSIAPPSKPEEVIQTSFRLPRSRWRNLQALSIDERVSVQSIIIGALEADFAKRGRTF